MVAFTSNLVSTSWGVTMDRRKFLKVGTTLAVAASSSAMAIDPVRYPHPDLVTLEPEFAGFLGNTPIHRLYSSADMLWAEGPAWGGWGNYLVWSDIPNNLQHRFQGNSRLS